MAAVTVERGSIVSNGVLRLDGVSLAIPDGAFIGIVGGSGSGKTTLLRAVAGLDRLDSGMVTIGGVDVTRSSPGDRDIGLVFQSPALLRHLSVRRNVSFPLELRRQTAEEIRNRVNAEARALQIEALLHRNPRELSQGEQQMVQIARTLVRVPNVMLLDEPFAALDEQLRHRMRSEIAILQAGYGVTTLMTTNDPHDVVGLVSRVAVLDAGRLVQYDETAAVHRSPATLLAAAATGPLSIVEMTVVRDGTGFWLMREDPSGGELMRIRAWSPALAPYVGEQVLVGIRPEHAIVSDRGSVPAIVERRIPVPPGSLQCVVAGARVVARGDDGAPVGRGDRVRLLVDHVVAFDRLTDAAIA